MMTRSPKTIEWDIGKDVHGRPVTLKQGQDYTGRTSFSIISHPISQRDEGERCHSLSRENLKALAEVETSLK